MCSDDPNTFTWSVSNANTAAITLTWWVVGGTATGGPVTVPANGTVTFTTPADTTLLDGAKVSRPALQSGNITVAIMWIDPVDGSVKSLSAASIGPCTDNPATPTPTPSPTPGVLIPVTGIDLPAIFRDSMFLNLGIGIFGFALILLGVGIRLDRGTQLGDEDEEYEEYYEDDEE